MADDRDEKRASATLPDAPTEPALPDELTGAPVGSSASRAASAPPPATQRLTVAAKAAGRDPWELVSEGACGEREVFVLADDIEAEYVYEDAAGGVQSENEHPVTLHQPLLVRPVDLVHLLAARGPIPVRRLWSVSEVQGARPPTGEGWALQEDLPITLDVLLVRATELGGEQQQGRAAGATVAPNQEGITQRRRAALLGLLAKMYCRTDKERLLFKDGTVKVGPLIEQIQSELQTEEGVVPRGFGKTKLREGLNPALDRGGVRPEVRLGEVLGTAPLESDIQHGLNELANPTVVVQD